MIPNHSLTDEEKEFLKNFKPTEYQKKLLDAIMSGKRFVFLGAGRMAGRTTLRRYIKFLEKKAKYDNKS